ncbi:hypothetical protein [Streptomyces sp. NPDC089795]|uniref:hypothetical protein n=1 Tax=Streptomyces sp. NPDC089795 TaxID=3155297 RepID=UPI0034394465
MAITSRAPAPGVGASVPSAGPTAPPPAGPARRGTAWAEEFGAIAAALREAVRPLPVWPTD